MRRSMGISSKMNIRALAAYGQVRRALRGVCEPSDIRRRVRFLVRESASPCEVSHSETAEQCFEPIFKTRAFWVGSCAERISKTKRTLCWVSFCFGDPYGNRTHASALRGPRLSRLTNGPFYCASILYHNYSSLSRAFWNFFQVFCSLSYKYNLNSLFLR